LAAERLPASHESTPELRRAEGAPAGGVLPAHGRFVQPAATPEPSLSRSSCRPRHSRLAQSSRCTHCTMIRVAGFVGLSVAQLKQCEKQPSRRMPAEGCPDNFDHLHVVVFAGCGRTHQWARGSPRWRSNHRVRLPNRVRGVACPPSRRPFGNSAALP